MLRSIFWKPYSHLLIVGDNAGWVIDDEAFYLKQTAEKLSIPSHILRRTPLNIPQTVHYLSQFSLINENIYKSKHKISVDYFHGKPEQDESFRKCFEALKKHHHQISRVRVSNKSMESLIKSSGIEAKKVVRIPIAVDAKVFTPQTEEKKKEVREKLGIPQDAIVIGSFQKDGSGWDEGLEPKWVKGPDIFIKVIEELKKEIPNIFVLLSGPSRGFVKKGLEGIGVPYVHKFPKDSKEISNFYDAIDLYIITSREEGGPKACLDSMSKGVPLITTDVGQCKDLVVSGENALMVPIDDVAKLSNLAIEVLKTPGLRERLKLNAFKTAQENSYESQLSLWKDYFHGIIE